MPTVYLAGPINTQIPETIQWRLEVKFLLWDGWFKVLDPCRGKALLEPSSSTDGGITSSNFSGKEILQRDFIDVKRSDVILVDLTDYQGLYPNKARIPIGTLCELGWAYAFGIPVIAFCTYSDASYNKLIRAHPFTSNIVSAWFDSVDLAVEHMVHFYGE